MTISKWRNQANYSDLFDSLFQQQTERFKHSKHECSPATNIVESESGFELELAIPGLKKEDFKINIEKDVLTISSEKETTKGDERNFTRREFVYGSFSRSYTLPKSIDQENISAEYTDGILKLVLPIKAEDKSKLSREISIN